MPGRVERDLKIVCGHWSTLGASITQGVHAIDTGAVWGGKLTALQLDTEELRVVQVPGREVEDRRRWPRAPRPPRERKGASNSGVARDRRGDADRTTQRGMSGVGSA